jgi:hypothetical protein
MAHGLVFNSAGVADMKEALKLALEALDALCLNDYSGYEMGKRDTHLVDTAIDAIKAALAQQEPDHGDELTIAYMSGVHRGKELAAQPAQGPVVFCMHWEDRWGCNHYVDPKEPHPANAKPLYTTPQQREPLTDDARGFLVIEHLGPNALLHKPMSIYDAFHMGIDAAEAAHGIKETTE